MIDVFYLNQKGLFSTGFINGFSRPKCIEEHCL